MKKSYEIGKEIGRNTRKRFGLFKGLLRMLFGRKRIVIGKGGAYSIYAFKNDNI